MMIVDKFNALLPAHAVLCCLFMAWCILLSLQSKKQFLGEIWLLRLVRFCTVLGTKAELWDLRFVLAVLWNFRGVELGTVGNGEVL
ncbi:hypothetical protein AALB81_19615 [Lachnospiraceae bacterium 48-33]